LKRSHAPPFDAIVAIQLSESEQNSVLKLFVASFGFVKSFFDQKPVNAQPESGISHQPW